ncbi:hypothetical protein, partial [Mycobacterium timonense]
ATEVAEPAPDDTAAATSDDGTSPWPVKSRQWTDTPIVADGRVAIITSRGIVKPYGAVIAGPMPSSDALHKFLVWHWGPKPKEQPQVWFTYEALTGVGVPMDNLPDDLPGLVAETFQCEVTWSQSGWFTCRFTDHDGNNRKAQIVLAPLLYLDPPPQRPGDMGVAGVEGTPTELPEDESEAVKILADRIAWLAGIGDAGLVPASRWATVGAQLLDRKRQSGRAKQIEACPLPTEVTVEAGGDLEPTLPVKWDNRPHRGRGDALDVQVDQRAAYLASAGQVELGFGKPKELRKIKVDVFHEQRPPFGLWRLNLPPAEQIDGMTTKLPLPHPHMSWKEPTTLWVTTRSIQHLTAPVEAGGAGLAVEELDITTAWVWPEQSRLLRGWADALRVKLHEAREADSLDYQQMIKAIYTTYLGRMASDKWAPYQRQHQQPAWYAAIRADTRFRALRYAAGIAAEHGLYPIAAELDALRVTVLDAGRFPVSRSRRLAISSVPRRRASARRLVSETPCHRWVLLSSRNLRSIRARKAAPNPLPPLDCCEPALALGGGEIALLGEAGGVGPGAGEDLAKRPFFTGPHSRPPCRRWST